MVYSVNFKGKEIISPSLLGFDLEHQKSLQDSLVIVEYKTSSYDQTWEQPWGEERYINEQYNEIKLLLAEQGISARKIELVFRVFDDGVGFRFFFPEQEHLSDFVILAENTEFNFTANHKAWWIKAFQPERYEYLYRSSGLNEIDSFAHTPLTMETADGLYLSIHEAELTDYASMTLKPSGQNGLQSELTPLSDGTKVKISTPCQTPWRTIQIAEKPGDLITSYLSLNLNPPNQLGDVTWIKPQKYIGIWWGMHIGLWTFWYSDKHGATTERAKQYIDFAAENGFGEILVEGWNTGWRAGPDWYLDDGANINHTQTTTDYDINAVQNYAQSRGVSLQMYYETMANTRNFLSQIDSAFAMAKRLGIHTAKIGQVGSRMDLKEYHHSQYGVQYYREVPRKAAEYQIAVNFHEPIKDTGERRTFPNMLTREGSRGTEYDAWSGDGGNPPEHTCILPFTRLLSGPMDFTPGIFEMDIPGRPKNHVNTTLAKQLALYVVIYSPLQMAADLIENYRNQPALQFIKEVPVDWETTKVLDAKIGDFIITARKDRNSEDWYVGGITDEFARNIAIKLDFLPKDKPYKAHIYRDGPDADYQTNPKAIKIDSISVSYRDSLPVKMARGGGFAIRFEAE